MAGSIVRRHLNKNFELSGVFASAAAFLVFLNKQAAEEGMLYFDTTLNQLRTFDGSSWSPAGQNGVSAGSLDDAANIGTKITIDAAFSTGLEIEATDAIISSNGQLLLLDNNDTGSDIHALEITSTSTAAAIQITNDTATTDDIQGTSDTWAVTGQGAATLTAITLGDSEPINIGASTDAVLQWDTTRLALTAAADSVFRIGAAAFSYDVEFIGQTAVTNLMKWDLDGGADSLGALIFDNVDLDLGDSDVLRFGDGADVTITWDASNLLIEALVQDTGEIRIGSTNALNLAVYGNTATDIALFDVSTAILEMNGWDMNLQDDDFLYFGDSNDVTIRWTSGQLDMLAAADDTVWTIGNGTNSFDIQIFGETSAADIVFDASANKLSLDGIDLKLEDDDYILLGDSATAGSTIDGTIRWDSTASEIEVIGNTSFEDTLTAVNLTVTGTLTASGGLAPGSLSLGDGENINFGDGNDYTISTAGSTAALILAAVNANDAINIGDGSVLTDFLIDNATVAGADVWFDASGDTNNGVWNFGKDDDGVDVIFFGATASARMTWDYSADQLVVAGGANISLNDNVELLLGTGASNAGDFKIDSDGSSLFIREIAAAGKDLQIGVNGKGLDVKFFGETASSFMLWDQSGDQLLFDAATLAFGDGDSILLGDTLGTGDFSITSTSAVLTIGQVASGTGTIAMGVTGKGIDQKWWAETAGDFMLWDQDGNSNLGALVFEDSAIQFAGAASTYTYAISTSAMLVTATDDSSAKVTWGDNGTNGLDQEWLSVSAGNLLNWDAGTETLKLTDVLCTMIGADSRGTILAITGNDTSGNSDTMTINHDGTAAGLKITCDGATSVALELASAASQTTTLALLDGTTGNWIGANDVGMLQLTKDTALANAGGSMLLVTNSAQPVSAAEGFMARFVDTGTAQTNAFGVQISVTSTTGALNVASGTSLFADAVTCTTGVQSSSVALEAQVEANQQTITAGSAFVTVSIANDANDVIILPTAVIGNVIRITVPATGCELQTAVAGSDQINGVDCSGANEMAMAAGSIYTLVCHVANKWVATGVDGAGAAQATIVPDADS